MTRRKLKLATRKWERQFNQAVAQSLAKTLTEPITNSYDSYKRVLGADDATTGLIERFFALKVGDHVVHDELVKDLPNRPRRTISIRLSTVGSAVGLKKRECQVTDQAEGMSAPEMERKFEKYGAEKSGVGEGLAVRGLFGQGICDVLYSHDPGEIRSVREGEASVCKFFWAGPTGDREPEYEVDDLGKATRRIHKEWGIADNGTQVSFLLDESCRIPVPDNLVARLSGFYMLRLINSDPYAEVTVEQHRTEGQVTSRLNYNFPRGQVIGKFSTRLKYKTFQPIEADVLVIRADTALPGKEAADDRANGLLVVDEVDSVYDQTLFSFDNSPYLDQVYGLVRLTGLRQLLRQELNKGEALLTESRDGFDSKRPFYKQLEEQLRAGLEPILKKEIDRRSESSKTLSGEAEKKVKKALQRLNELFEDVTKVTRPGGPGGPGIEVPETMKFEDERVQLKLGIGRRVRLFANAAHFRPGAPVLVESDSPNIKIEPSATTLDHHGLREGLLQASFTVLGMSLGERARITALSQEQKGTDVEAILAIVDVVVPEVVDPPVGGIEFRPTASHTGPNRLGSLSLYVNPVMVPLGSSIAVRKLSGDPGIKLVDQAGLDKEELIVAFDGEHLLPGASVGRVLVHYRGYGFGQTARLVADCFPKHGRNLRAEARVSVEESKPSFGGVFRGVQYKDLPGSFAKNASEFDPTTGLITINRLHPVNRASFGIDEKAFRQSIDTDRASQFRLSEVVVDTCLFHMMAVAYENSEINLPKEDVVSSVRKSLEGFKAQVEEDVFRQFVEAFRVPKLDVRAPKP